MFENKFGLVERKCDRYCSKRVSFIRNCFSVFSVNNTSNLFNFIAFHLRTGKSAYMIEFNEQAIKTEIYRNGPVQGSVKMYSDLYNYKSGKLISVADISLHENLFLSKITSTYKK